MPQHKDVEIIAGTVCDASASALRYYREEIKGRVPLDVERRWINAALQLSIAAKEFRQLKDSGKNSNALPGG